MAVVTVGPSGSGAQFDSIGSALASISGTPADRGTVVVFPGQYDERIDDNKSHVDVVAKASGSAIITTTLGGSGGTYRIATDATARAPVVDKVISGLRIMRNSAGTVSGRPEAALYVGQESGGGFPEDLYWNDITIKNCIVEGVHDAIQCFGQDKPTGEKHPPVGTVTIKDCIIRCAHDALTIKGNMRMISQNNLFRVDSRGVPPYLTDVAPWKTTGFHMNCRPGQGPTGNSNSYFLSDCDTMHITGSKFLHPDNEDQRHLTGYLFYDLRSAFPTQDPHTIHRTEIIAPHVVLEYFAPDDDSDPPDEIAGIAVIGRKLTIPEEGLVVRGGSFLIRQLRTDEPVPAYGVLVDTIQNEGTGVTNVRVVGTRIKVENVNSQGACLSMKTVNAADRIEGLAYTDEVWDDGAGAVVQAELQPV